MDRSETAKRLQACFDGRHPEVVAAYLFGSVARGEAREDSDVDVAVLLDRDPPRTLEGLRFDLADELTACLGAPVDLAILNRASADFVHRVLRDGILVAERDRGARIRFEVYKRNEYFDILPILLRYRRSRRSAS